MAIYFHEEDLPSVDLFAPEESNIRPGDGARISSLGTDVPEQSAENGTARSEFWPLLVTLALLFLVIEWLVYERDGARRIGAAVRRRIGELSPRRRAT